MDKARFCKHCQQQYIQRRSNHLYCSASCRTKASYERNGYKYISGHYEKIEHSDTKNLPSTTINDDLILAVQSLEKRVEQLGNHNVLNANSVKEAALGTMAADVGVYAAKRLFAPKSLPATKGDVEAIKEEIKRLSALVKLNR